ncbi:hypothetical protein FQN54_002184 [Arachnomyces sp. PD_36]|nr:hypothetical protein FQN54_002184 [Arachnomyces sp. PD_36]
MNPHQQNKVDLSKLSPDEQRLLRLYGKMPNKKDLLQNKLKERKYFDSGDYALSKAGKASDVGVTNIGSKHPLPENIPHLSATSSNASNGHGQAQGGNGNGSGNGQHHGSFHHNGHQGSISLQGRSPVKEGSFLQRETDSEGKETGEQKSSQESTPVDKDAKEKESKDETGTSPPPAREGVPIRR